MPNTENKDKKPTAAKTAEAKKPSALAKKSLFKKPTEKKAPAAKEEKPAEKKAAEKKPAEKKTAEKKPAAKKPAAKKPAKKAETKKRGLFNTKYLSGLLFSKMAKGGTEQLSTHADEVNQLNVFPVPDGDTGDNMRMTIESGLAEVEKIDSDDLSDVMKALSHGMLLGARGNSGVILSQFFAGIAKKLEASDKADAATLGAALEVGVEQAYASVMTPTEGTILTVAREGVAYAVSRITPKSTIPSFFSDLVQGMQDTLNRTPEMLTALKEANVVDSGGAGLFYIIDGFNRVLNGEEVGKKKKGAKKTDRPASMPSPALFAFGPDSKMTFGYCTELLLQLQHKKTDIDAFTIEPVKEFLAGIGDSVVAFKTDSIVKIHVHTFTPDKVLAYCLQYGEFLTVKIENMSVQHSDLEEKEPAAAKMTQDAVENKDINEEDVKIAAAFPVTEGTAPTATPAEPAPVLNKEPKKRYGTVAVSNGDGIEALFREFGVDGIIHGGQTNNPSTNDFLNIFPSVNAEHIFVFPNNGNIVMAAQQAAELYTEAKVHVIPTKNIGTGYVAVSSINYEEENVDAVIEGITSAIANVTSGYISPSIRDTDISGVHINKGDTIGIIEKEIVVSLPDQMKATCALATNLLAIDGKFMLTVFVGADATEEEKATLEAHVQKFHPTAELYFIYGGQEIYPFIFTAE